MKRLLPPLSDEAIIDRLEGEARSLRVAAKWNASVAGRAALEAAAMALEKVSEALRTVASENSSQAPEDTDSPNQGRSEYGAPFRRTGW